MKRIIFLSFIAIFLHAKGCWTTQELAKFGFDELDGVTTFSFKDAITCKPISGAEIKVLGIKKITDKNGRITLPNPPENINTYITISISKDGYIPVTTQIPVMVGSFWKTRFLLSKAMPINSARFVLAWGDKPKDLDLHLKSSSFHISYHHKKSIANKAELDRDARNGYGPETITLDKIDKNEKYRIIVSRYSHDGYISPKASVSVYINNRFDKTIFLPNTTKSCLEIATIKNGKIHYKIKVLNPKECK